MNTLTIDEKKARQYYPTASTDFKTDLVSTFGEAFFSQKPWERVKTFADACEVLDMDPDDIYHEDDTPDEIAYKQLKVITRAVNFLANGNKEWVPDYNNASQQKWVIWWYLNEPGFRLNVVVYVLTGSSVGSRLVFIAEEPARYAAGQFKDIYQAYHTRQSNSANGRISLEEINSFEDACKVKGYDPEKIIPDFSVYPEPHRKALVAAAKLFIGIEALNYIDNGYKDWVPYWDDDDEKKHYPFVDLEVDENNPSGFRLDDVDCDDAFSCVGSRLVYRNTQLAKRGFKIFEDQYRDLMVRK